MSVTTSDKAINRVLSAEKEAHNEVALCRRQAALIIKEGRNRARHIMNRADNHINNVHSIADHLVEQTLVNINTDTKLLSEPPALDEIKLAGIEKAISLLISELLGANHEY